MSQYDELKRLAEDAKNWGGEVGEDRWYTAECFKQPYFSVPDAEFIAACEPGNIRALIAENDRLEVDNGSLRGSTKRMGEDVSKMQKQMRKLQREAERLKTEIEALRMDAERYRGVRRVANRQGFTDEQFDQQTDTRIANFDAAMGKGEQP